MSHIPRIIGYSTLLVLAILIALAVFQVANAEAYIEMTGNKSEMLR